MSRATTQTTDVLVIGGGPAGSIAAAQCARAGLRTMIVERCVMPRSKVCGCCLTTTGVATLERAGAGHVVADAASVTRVRLCSGRRDAAFSMPVYRVLSRERLDMRLWEFARSSGALTLDGASATVHKDGTASLGQGERTWTVAPGCIIAADGIGGTSLRELDAFAWDVRHASHMGLGARLAQAPFAMTHNELTMLVTDDGYAGLVMLPDGGVDVAAAVSPLAVRTAGGASAWLAALLASHGARAGALDGVKVHGTPLLTRRRTRVADGNVLLAGDAAGYVEPFTGEGMTWALRTGTEVVTFAQRMAAVQGPARGEIARAWTARWHALMRPRHAACMHVAAWLRTRWLREAGLLLAAAAPRAGSLLARRVLAGHEVAA